MVREAGAAEVHMRIASPPTTHSCFYGVDTPERIASCSPRACPWRRWPKFIGVDSLAFLSIDGLYRAVGEARATPAQPQFCDACFTGDYPTRHWRGRGRALRRRGRPCRARRPHRRRP
jgi:amidophosphoribosyltransferase